MRRFSRTGLVLFFLGLTLPRHAQTPAQPITPPAVTVEEVRQFLEEYKHRFMKMEIGALTDLFSKEAVENRVFPFADISERYRKTFDDSDSILYRMEIYPIQAFQKDAFVSGRYVMTQFLKGKSRRILLQGPIQWDPIRENGSLKIKEINYGRSSE
jgi:hypothetical protein